eukprot:1337163-Amphidinium_carterae.1
MSSFARCGTRKQQARPSIRVPLALPHRDKEVLWSEGLDPSVDTPSRPVVACASKQGVGAGFPGFALQNLHSGCGSPAVAYACSTEITVFFTGVYYLLKAKWVVWE